MAGGGDDMAGGCFTNVCYIVWKTTTRCMPPTDVVAAWGAVFYFSTELPICTNSNRWSMCCSHQGTWTWLGNQSESNVLFGNRGLNSHSEETKKVRFLEFLVS